MPDLEVYIQKILDLQDQTNPAPLTLEERKALAFELGLSEADWERLEASYADHIARGKTFARYQNWDDALAEFEQAYAVNPYDPDLVYETARAYAKRWMHRQAPDDRRKAEELTRHLLQLQPEHEEGARLLTDLRTRTAPAENKRALKILLILLIALAAAALFILWALFS